LLINFKFISDIDVKRWNLDVFAFLLWKSCVMLPKRHPAPSVHSITTEFLHVRCGQTKIEVISRSTPKHDHSFPLWIFPWTLCNFPPEPLCLIRFPHGFSPSNSATHEARASFSHPRAALTKRSSPHDPTHPPTSVTQPGRSSSSVPPRHRSGTQS
jgi:hypothetical protein